MALHDELTALLRGEVDTDDRALTAASHDASIFELRPHAVVHPWDAADVGTLVRYAAASKGSVSLTPRSGGTDMSGAALTESVVVDMTKHFGHIVRMDADSVTVQPGLFYRDLEAETLKHDLLLPSFPASREICTVGGMAANNSGGEKSLRYGKTANFVRQLKMVLRDGKEYAFGPLSAAELDAKLAADGVEGDVYRAMRDIVDGNAEQIRGAKPSVTKNSAGYALWDVRDEATGTFDLSKVIVGSQGTLGVITEITYGLVRPSKQSQLLVIYLKDLNALPDTVSAVMAHGPESFESYDDHTFKFAIRYWRDITQFMASKSLIGLAKEFWPEVGMILRHGFPKQVMIAEFTGDDPKEIEGRVDAVMASLQGRGLGLRKTTSARDANKYWVMRRESFNLLRRHFKKMKAAPFIDDFCVHPKDLPTFLPKLYAILDRYDFVVTLVGHVGDGNFHVIPLMDLSRPDIKEIIDTLSREVYALVFQYGGSMTGEHNDGLIRSPYLEDMFGAEVCELFARTKQAFDPDGIFNPGKKVGADLAFALNHIKKS